MKTSESEEFESLQARLPDIWKRIREDGDYPHTSIVVPSLSVDQRELARIEGAAFYEERLLFTLMRLRHPHAQVLYVTSQPIHSDIIDYYLHLLVGIPAAHARRRLALLCAYDAGEEPLTKKILRRPRLIERIQKAIQVQENAYLTCFNSTDLERELALKIGIPLNGLDPALTYWGTKSGSRNAFSAAGINHPEGANDLKSEDEVIDALLDLSRRRPGIHRAVIKLDHGFAGEGNAIYTYPDNNTAPSRDEIVAAITQVSTAIKGESHKHMLARFSKTGGIVEEMIEAAEIKSPSVQMRITPDGEVRLVSSHEQLLGGTTGQVYVGCRFPAHDDYRSELQSAALKVGYVLRDKGVRSRFAIDFITSVNENGKWHYHAVEINLRMTGTTHPFMALEFLTGGSLDDFGHFRTPGGNHKYYIASDNLKSPNYKGLLPEDLMDIVVDDQLNFSTSTQTGVLFHIIGALSQFGKVGVTCIGNTPLEAEQLYKRTVEVLDQATGAGPAHGGQPSPLLDRNLTSME